VITKTPFAALIAASLILSACGNSQDVSAPNVARCVDSRPEPVGGVGLKSTVLKEVNDGIEVTWTTTTPMPRRGTVLYSISAYSMDGNVAKQLGVGYQDGVQNDFFSFDTGEAQQTNFDGTAEVAGRRVRVVFPKKAFDHVGEPFHWDAGYSFGANDDICPDGADDLKHPQSMTFPA
jgi:hypothetical protein